MPRKSSGFRYDVKAGRYRDTRGRFVPKSRVEAILTSRIDEGIGDMGSMLDAVLSGSTTATLEDWQDAMAFEIRNQHYQMTLLGAGGRKNITPADWGRMGASLKVEYGYLANFTQQVASGELSEKQIRARMTMYGEGSWKSFWKAKTNTVKRQTGATHESRHLDHAAESCDDCVGMDISKKGRVEIGTLPDPGEGSVCKSKCRCGKSYWVFFDGRWTEVAA